jgi:serine/threonine protein kinase|tara:strand:- start:652 stop:1584 length:933 start_codon:yes stop_codon:yes gene_type:complete
MSSFIRDEGTIIGNKYKIINKIGKGTFGVVYKGENIRTKELVAIKIETLTSKHSLLKREAKISRQLEYNNGIAKIKWYGVDSDNIYVVFELLGVTLSSYIERLKKFSLKTTIVLGIQMIERIKSIHVNGILHRDIKPDNFIMGRNDTHILYIIDFGLSKNYIINNKHIKERHKKKMIGTVRYASINIHNGIESSRRDDLISIGYVLIYFLKGSLPWQGVTAKTKEEKYEKIGKIKQDISIDELCSGLPDKFKQYFEYCYYLNFDDEPNYHMLCGLLVSMLPEKEIYFDKILYDWDIKLDNSLIEVDLNSL